MNLQKMIKQAQAVQGKLNDVKTRFEAQEIEGQSGGGMIKVTITGKGTAKKIDIDPSLVNPAEKEMLEDLVVAAFNDAKQKSDAAFTEEMSAVTAGLPIPPDMKFPF